MPLSLTYTLGELIKRFCGSVNPDRPLTGLLDIDGPVLIYRIDEDQGLQRRGNVPRFALTQILPNLGKYPCNLLTPFSILHGYLPN